MTLNLDWMVSVDDHLVEAPDLWTKRLPSKYHDRCPHVERSPAGHDVWVYDGITTSVPGVGAVVGRKMDDWSIQPLTYDEIHPSTYDPAERIKSMDVAGILAETNFPTVPRFCGQIFWEAKDKDLALLCLQAWNDHILEEWCDAYPGRFIGLIMIPLWDPKLAVAEAERCAAKGATAIMFSENPSMLGLPSIHDKDGYWNPLFEFADTSGMPLCLHIGSSSHFPTTSADAPSIIRVGSGGGVNAIQALWDWIFSGHFFAYENLKIVLSEGNAGWVPYMLSWMEHTLDRQRWARDSDFDADYGTGTYVRRDLVRKIVDAEVTPTQLFRKHIYTCITDDPVAIELVDRIGVDNLMVESDFPHSDGWWPDSIQQVRKMIAPLSPEDQYKVLVENACRVFNFTPATPPVTAQ